MTASAKPPMYYGWKIVIALLVQLTFNSGLSFYNHAIYLNALAENSSFDVQTASSAISIFFLSGGLTGLLVARWVRDYDPRLSITAGSVLAGLALSALPFIESLWQLYVVYIIFGMGFSASGLIPATTLVTRWFQRRRAMALSIASTGLSLGGVILTPLSVLLVDRVGFATAAPLLGLIFVIGVVPITLLLLRPYPESMGLMIDGETPRQVDDQTDETTAAGDTKETGITFKQALRGRFFWGVSFAYIFLMMAQVGGIAHQYGLAREQLTDAETAIAVAILPVASIIGRLIGGWLVDRMSIRIFAIGMMVLQAVSLSLLAGGFSVLTLCVGLFLFGSSVGNLLMLQPLLIAEAFGVLDYARIFSVSNLMTSLGTSIGPALLGIAYAASANLYTVPYMVAAGAGALGFLLFLGGGPLEHAKVKPV
ncbi:MAG: MFS transporter [Pseudomonadales bacterium]|nr:MFS transporter [Pseudomonadales bacterium]